MRSEPIYCRRRQCPRAVSAFLQRSRFGTEKLQQSKAKTSSPKGRNAHSEKHGMSVLIDENIYEIRDLFANWCSNKQRSLKGLASREATLETLGHSGAGNTCPSNQTTTNDYFSATRQATSSRTISAQDLTNSIQAYSANCHMLRQHLIKEFGYTVKDANEFMNDIVRGAYRYPQDKS